METVTGYFRVLETPSGSFEVAVYKTGFAPADFADRIIIDEVSTEAEALKLIQSVRVTVERNVNKN